MARLSLTTDFRRIRFRNAQNTCLNPMKSSESGGFSPRIKRDLADRAGHHCSLCLALTTCSDKKGKPFRIGDAAHQAAASKRGPRSDPLQSKEERSSAKNGLWLCSSCHRKIDGDKYRYTVDDLRQMKDEAEDRARRMVHGEIIFEMKDKEDAAIEHYLRSRPLRKEVPKSASGAMLGVQVIPYSAITDRPRLAYPDLVKTEAPTTQDGSRRPETDEKGIFAEFGQEVSRIDRDATAQLWMNYPGIAGTPPDRRLPGAKIAKDVLRFLRSARTIFEKHGIRNPKIIVRMRLENVLERMLVDGKPLRKSILNASCVILDREESHKALEELWYCAGARVLPDYVVQILKEFSETSSA
jgi:hypothetical protein